MGDKEDKFVTLAKQTIMNKSNKKKYPVLDIHAHLGNHKIPRMSVNDDAKFIDTARRAGITASVVSHADALGSRDYSVQQKFNKKLLSIAEKNKQILVWWVTDPTQQASLDSVREIATHPLVVGCKVHPRLHNYPFSQYAGEICTLAEDTNLPVITHAGNKGNMPTQIVKALRPFSAVKFIIAHFGNCGNYKDHVNALKQAGNNVLVDTSSAVSIECGLIEQGVKELGAQRFLFGSDHPCYHPSSQAYRIYHADLDENTKRRILWQNAAENILKPSQVEIVKELFNEKQ
ncbi:MAG: amidohydrolase family protein [Planctomycetota bacterium]